MNVSKNKFKPLLFKIHGFVIKIPAFYAFEQIPGIFQVPGFPGSMGALYKGDSIALLLLLETNFKS